MVVARPTIDRKEAHMEGQKRRWSPERIVALGAIAIGLVAGTYGVASAANGSSSGGTATAAATPAAARGGGQPWGRQRGDETGLTGDALAKVRAAAVGKVSGGTVVRIETDADGNAAYEAHMTKADGTPVTVYVNKQYEVVGVESGMAGPPPSGSSGASA
jgi:hypothetical protein